MIKKNVAVPNAQAAWGEKLPDWVMILAEECDRTSQGKAARRIGYSAGTVNTVLKATYNGDLSRVESAVRGALMNATVQCPVDLEITTNVCLSNQRRQLNTSSPRSVAIYRACRGTCVHSRIGVDHA